MGFPALALATLAAYLVGAFPSGWLAGRIRGGVDLGDRGSGNVGASNALRVLGPASAFIVVALDIGKGWLAAAHLARWMPAEALPDPSWPLWIVGLAAVLGHIRPPLSSLRGGKGVAATAGVWLAASPLIFVAAVTGFALVAWISRRASVASLTAVTGLAVVTAAGWWDASSGARAFAALSAALVLFTHRSNLRNLVAGTEPKF